MDIDIKPYKDLTPIQKRAWGSELLYNSVQKELIKKNFKENKKK